MLKTIKFIIGILFMSSGILKAFDTMTFAHTISQYGIPYSDYFAFIIIGIEIIIGLSWLLDIYSKLNSIVTTVITIIFTVILFYGFNQKGITDCGCMGNFVEIPIWVSFTRNILILLGCAWIWKNSTWRQPSIPQWKIVIVLIFSCLGSGLAGLSTGIELYNKHEIKVGQKIEDTFLSQFKEKLSGKRSFAFIFSPTCSHCWNASENVKSIKAQPELGELIGVVAEDIDATDYVEIVKPNFEIFTVKTDVLRANIKGVPLLVEFQNGRVTVVHKPENIPSGAYLKQFSK